jgi:carbamate kinase
MTTDQTLLIAIGGNSLILEGQRGTIAEQFENSRTTARQGRRRRLGGAGERWSPTATARGWASFCSGGVSVLLLSTGVEQVAIRFRKPDQRSLERVTVDEARQYLAAGEFAAGSMGPKIEAAIAFLEHDGREVVITSPDHLADAVAGRTGTHITAH